MHLLGGEHVRPACAPQCCFKDADQELAEYKAAASCLGGTSRSRCVPASLFACSSRRLTAPCFHTSSSLSSSIKCYPASRSSPNYMFHLLALSPGTETAEDLLQRASSNGNDAAAKKPFDGRAFRRSLGKTGRYQRNPINDPASLALMEEHGVGYSTTGLIAQMRLNGNLWQQGVRSRTAAWVLGISMRCCEFALACKGVGELKAEAPAQALAHMRLLPAVNLPSNHVTQGVSR